jgi:hypothetical protein
VSDTIEDWHNTLFRFGKAVRNVEAAVTSIQGSALKQNSLSEIYLWVMEASGAMGLLLMFTILLVSGAGASAEDVTVNGITYSNITWGTVTPSTASIIYSSGIISVNLSDLSPELRHRFNYNPTNDATYRTAEAQQEALRNRQRQEAWARAAQQREAQQLEQKRRAAMERINVQGTVERSLGDGSYLVSLTKITTTVSTEYVRLPTYGGYAKLRAIEHKSTQPTDLGMCVMTLLPNGLADKHNFVGFARVSDVETNLAVASAGSEFAGTYHVYEWDGEK